MYDVGAQSAKVKIFGTLSEATSWIKLTSTADFFGINHYTSSLVSNVKPSDPDQPAIGTRNGDCGTRTSVDPTWEPTIASWFYVAPKGMRGLLNWIKDEYNNPPVIITESGYPDNGGLKDEKRVRYYQSYLLEVLKAIHYDGCQVIGYTAWSLMDNYEWFFGYAHKFGLYYVDFTDPERPRSPKMSAYFYQRLISTGKVPKEGDIDFPEDDTTQMPPSSTPSSSPSRSSAAAFMTLVSIGSLLATRP